jgi:hypothetical protein
MSDIKSSLGSAEQKQAEELNQRIAEVNIAKFQLKAHYGSELCINFFSKVLIMS